MKLLIYVHSLENGGAERVVANLANHWASIGWQLIIVTVAPRTSDFYALDPAIGRVSLGMTDGSEDLLAGALRTVHRVRALRRILRSVRPDVALAAMQTASVILALAASGLPGVLTLGSEHNFPAKAPLGLARDTLRRLAYGRLGAVVGLTTECAAWLKANTRARCVPVIPNPVCWPLAEQEPRVDPGSCCRDGRRVLLGVGRLSEEKNFATLIDVFRRLAARHPGWDLVILGEGPMRDALAGQVSAAGLAGRVFLPGRVGNVGVWYARADLYAMSSHFEGFPNTLVEAMASGLPAVSVDCDTGPRDIIRHDVDGYLVAPGDTDGMAAFLDRLMGSDDVRSMFAARAIEVRERFSMQKIASMWADLIGKLSGDGTAPAIRDQSAVSLRNAAGRDQQV
jgi:glycosyltransferase involved in cell wall biosynthesis